MPSSMALSNFTWTLASPIESQVLLDLMSRNRQRITLLGAHRQAFTYGIIDVLKRLFLRPALTHAARNRGALDDPHAVFVPINGDVKHHRLNPLSYAVGNPSLPPSP